MAAADRGETPPPALELSWQCKRYGSLPDSGGVRQQEYQVMRDMAVLSNVYDVKARLKNMVGAQIHQLTASERRMLRWLSDEGLLNG